MEEGSGEEEASSHTPEALETPEVRTGYWEKLQADVAPHAFLPTFSCFTCQVGNRRRGTHLPGKAAWSQLRGSLPLLSSISPAGTLLLWHRPPASPTCLPLLALQAQSHSCLSLCRTPLAQPRQPCCCLQGRGV